RHGELRCGYDRRLSHIGSFPSGVVCAVQHLFEAVAEGAQLANQAFEFAGVQNRVRAVVAQVQPRHAVEIAYRQVARALFPVETQAAPRVGVSQRYDGGGDAQIASAMLAFHFSEIDTLLAAVFKHQVETDLIWRAVAQGMNVADMGANGFEMLQDRSPNG